MKRTAKKLDIRHETIRVLTPSDLRRAVGGAKPTTTSTGSSCPNDPMSKCCWPPPLA